MFIASERPAIVFRGGRAAWVVRAFIGLFVCVLMVGMAYGLLIQKSFVLFALTVPVVALLACGTWSEIAKAVRPNCLRADQNGVHLLERGTWFNWSWDDYFGVVGKVVPIGGGIFYRLKVAGSKGDPRLVVIGPFRPELAAALRDYAAAMGREVH